MRPGFDLVVATGDTTADIMRFFVPDTETPFPGDRDFYISTNSFSILSLFLGSIFGSASLIEGPIPTDVASMLASALYISGDITKSMADLATSLTTSIRTLSNSTVISGKTFTVQPYITVHWAWISLPVATCVLALTFLLVLISLSERYEQPLWKGSALALLFHNAEYEDGGRVQTGVDTLKNMDAAARSMRAELRKDDGVMKLFLTGACEEKAGPTSTSDGLSMAATKTHSRNPIQITSSGTLNQEATLS